MQLTVPVNRPNPFPAVPLLHLDLLSSHIDPDLIDHPLEWSFGNQYISEALSELAGNIAQH